MSRSRRVRQEFIEKAKLSVKRSGFPNQRALAENLGMALSTISNFLNGKSVDGAYFGEICEKLSLDIQAISTFDGQDTGEDTPEETPEPPPSSSPAPSAPRQDWGEAVDVSTFYGRVEEIKTLNQWMVGDSPAERAGQRCRLVMLIGMGGIGKTALSVKVAEQVQGAFDAVVWRSLRNAPPIQELLGDLLGFLSNQQETALPESLDGKISRLMAYLRESRCLLILDNMESILVGDDRAGSYRAGYEGYGQLLRCIGETRHESCLLLTSREKPRGLSAKEGKTLPIRSLRLPGLEQDIAQEIFREKGFTVSGEEIQQLVQHYAGNPLALKIVATTIEEVFDGNATAFLHQGTVIFGDIFDLLEQQFNRLTVLEQHIMFWLAINREAVSLAELQTDLVPTVGQRSLLESLESLQFRSLIEKNASSFTQQSVVMEYVTARIIEQVCQEIILWNRRNDRTRNAEINPLLNTHALIKAQSKDYLRIMQVRLILKPIAEQLLTELGHPKTVEGLFQEILVWLRSHPPRQPGYGAGNLLNLLWQLQLEPRNYDFSNLAVWQAYLQGMNLHQVNLSGADVSRSTFKQTLGGILSAGFSPDGSLLATGIEQEIWLWQVSDGKQVGNLRGHTGWVQAIAFNRSQETPLLASGSYDQTIRVWNPQTGQCLKTLRGHTGWIQTLAFSPDSQFLASGSSDHTIRLWNLQTGECLKILEGHTASLLSVAFCPEGQTLVSTSDDQTVKQWDIATNQCLKTIPTTINWVLASALSPDGKTLVTGSDGQTVKYWDVETGKLLWQLPNYSHQVWSIAFSPDGETIATGSEDQTIKIWDVTTRKCLQTFQEHQDRVWLVEFSPDGRSLVSISEDHVVKFWDIQNSQCLRTLDAYSNWTLSVAFSTDGKQLASGSQDHRVRIWDVETGECTATLQGHTNLISTVSFIHGLDEPTQRLASGSDDHTIRLWDCSIKECIVTLWGHDSWIQSISISPDGKILASGSRDHTVKLWDHETGECLHTLRGHTNRVKTVAFSPHLPDGTLLLASAGDDQTIKLWAVETGECVRSLEGHESMIASVAWSPCGQKLVSGSGDSTLKLLDVETGQCLHTLRGHTHRVRSVAFSPDGRTIASGSDDQTIKLWDAQTGELLDSLQGHTKTVWSVTFNPAQSPQNTILLASASSDETIRLWDLASKKCVKVLRSDRPYEGMNIYNAIGLTASQKATLRALGAVETCEVDAML